MTTVIAPARAVTPMSTKMTASAVTGPSPRWASAVPLVLARLWGPIPRSRCSLPHLHAFVLGVAAGSSRPDPAVGYLQLGQVGERVVGEHVGHDAVGTHQQLFFGEDGVLAVRHRELEQ